MSGATLRSIARAALGIGISIAAFILVLGSVDIDRTVAVLRRTDTAWILVAVVATAADAALRAARWQSLLAPIRKVPYRSVLRYTMIGYLANNVLPARMGELVRSHVLGDREGLSRSAVLGTVVVERVVDTALVVLIAATMIVALHVGGAVATAVVVGAAIAGVLAIGLGLGIAIHRLPGAARFIAFGSRWPRVAGPAARLRNGLSVARRPRTLSSAILLSVVAWTFTTLAFAVAGRAIGLNLSPADAALVGSGTALATAIPSGPGYLGTFELAAVRILEALGVGGDAALAYALLVHATIIVTTSVIGVVAAAQVGLRREALS